MPAAANSRDLRQFPLFESLTDAEVELVARHLHTRSFPSGTNVITFEMPGDVVYIIRDGTLKIKVDQPDGKEVIIALLGAGEVVGELSLIDGVRRSADVFTQEECTLLWLDRRSFESLMESIPQLTRNLLRILTRRVRLSTEQIQALGTLDVPGKVARQLLVFADQYGVAGAAGILIPMRLTQSDLAGMVGASRERVNQAFAGLKQLHLIDVSTTHRITVLNIEKLRKMVQDR
jgi:CRP/FNR family cyclic AMP-dependent transcriptional regulator